MPAGRPPSDSTDVRRARDPHPVSDCIFCGIVERTLPASIAFEDATYLAFMDIHPWRPGHLLVIPRLHRQYVGELPEGVAGGLLELGGRLAAALRASEVPCDDVHLLINDGRAANQSVPHVHLHVVPRRRGDLAALASNLLVRPLAPLLGPAPRARLDEQAAAVRRHM